MQGLGNSIEPKGWVVSNSQSNRHRRHWKCLKTWSWTVGSVLTALIALAGDLEFNSQYTHGGSELSITTVLEAPGTLFWPPRVPDSHTMHIHTCRENITHTMNLLKKSIKCLKTLIEAPQCRGHTRARAHTHTHTTYTHIRTKPFYGYANIIKKELKQ